MSVLSRKLLRDLRAQRGLAIAVAVVMILGVLLFVATAGAYEDLQHSYSQTRRTLALAPLHAALPGAVEPQLLSSLRALPSVTRVEPRLVTELPVTPSAEARRRPTLRVLSLPEEGAAALDRTQLLSGALPGAGEVLLEKHFAQHHALTAGSTLQVPGGPALRVSGVAVAAEYLWVARDENDLMPSPDEFGVGWMRRDALRAEATALLANGTSSPSLALAAGDAPGNELLIDGTGTLEALRRSVERALPEAAHVTPADELVGVKLLQMDLDGYQGMAIFFPLFFLGVGMFILATVLARLVSAQRPLIGTFLALGVSRGVVLRHYLSFALVLGGGGAVLGAVLGALLAPQLTQAYATELGIPFVQSQLHADLVLIGVGLGLVVSLLAGLVPAVRALRLEPAAAMRPPPPSVSTPARWARRLRGPLPVQLAVRDILDRPLRSLGTALGVAAAVVLVLATGVLMDSMRVTFDSLFSAASRYDVRVDFGEPAPAAGLVERAAQLEGVDAAEPLLVLPARLAVSGRHLDALVQALGDDQRLVHAADADGTEQAPTAGSLVLTRHAARELGLGVGDAVTVTPPGLSPLELKVSGFADAAMGTVVSVRRADVEQRWGLTGLATAVVVRAHDAQAARAALVQAFPHALRIEDRAATRTQFELLMQLGWLMVSLMLVFGGVLAGAILFNTATLLVLERQRELATLEALGLRMREVTAMVTTQHAVLALLGLALGVPLSVLASRAMLASFSGELFAFPFVLQAPTVAVTLVGVFVVVLLAQWPALRKVAHASLAEAVRVRS